MSNTQHPTTKNDTIYDNGKGLSATINHKKNFITSINRCRHKKLITTNKDPNTNKTNIHPSKFHAFGVEPPITTAFTFPPTTFYINMSPRDQWTIYGHCLDFSISFIPSNFLIPSY